MGLELAKAYVIARADTSKLSGDFSGATGAVEGILKGLVGRANGLLMQIGLPLAGGAFLTMGVRAAAAAEQMEIAFGTMLGSAEAAKKTMEDLTTFAAKTPFEMPEITQAARGLIQFGERGDDLMKTLDLLGNAASGTSTDFGMVALIFNQVRGVGKLLTQDFRQLSTRGIISLQDIADYYGVATNAAQEMLSKGKVSFEDLRGILGKLSGEGGRFANMMEKQSQSLSGLYSTLKDNFNLLARAISTPLAGALKTLTSDMNMMIGTLQTVSGGLKGAFGPNVLPNILRLAGGLVALKVAMIAGHLASLKLASGIALIASHPHIAAFAVIIAGSFAIGKALSGTSEVMKKASESMGELVDKGDKMRDSHLSLSSRLTELSQKQNLTDREMEEAGNIISTLNGYYGDLGISMDATTGKINIQAGAWSNMSDKMARQKKAALEAQLSELKQQELLDRMGPGKGDWSKNSKDKSISGWTPAAAWRGFKNDAGKALGGAIREAKSLLSGGQSDAEQRTKQQALALKIMEIRSQIRDLERGQGSLGGEKKTGPGAKGGAEAAALPTAAEIEEPGKAVDALKEKIFQLKIEEMKASKELADIMRMKMVTPEQIAEAEKLTKTLKEMTEQKNIKDSLKGMNSELMDLTDGLTSAERALKKFSLQPGVTPKQIQMFKDLYDQIEAAKLTDSLQTPMENARKEFDRLRDLFSKGLITKDTYERGLEKAKSGLEKERTGGGRVGALEFGQQLQNTMLKQNQIPKQQLEEQKLATGLLGDIRTAIQKLNTGSAMTLTGP